MNTMQDAPLSALAPWFGSKWRWNELVVRKNISNSSGRKQGATKAVELLLVNDAKESGE